MFSIIRNILEGKGGKGGENRAGRELKMHIAAGVVLLEAVHIDNDCNDAEMEHVVETLRDRFGVADDCISELLELAHVERKNAIDLWQFTNDINRTFPREDKKKVMEEVWRIFFADGQLDRHEDHFAHKLANLLRLSHQEMIDAKLRAREQRPPE